MCSAIKGGIFASFVVLIGVSSAFADDARSKQLQLLSERTEWHALLHINHGKFLIQGERFYLSQKKQRSAYNELLATLSAFNRPINEFDDPSDHPICRFPARYQWLHQQLNFSENIKRIPDCGTSYDTFLSKVPVKQIALTYASADVTNPSSMMGHVFIKVSGTTENRYRAEHALTYFTVLDSYNILKIIYENLFSGMEGYFALRPYRDLVSGYLKERRNIWEYDLSASDNEKALIQKHIWELKNSRPTYYFIKHNCATFTADILKIIYPDLKGLNKTWVDPLSVVKAVNNAGLVYETEATTSDRWKLQMLKEESDFDVVRFVQRTSRMNIQEIRTELKNMPPKALLFVVTYLRYLEQNQPKEFNKQKAHYDSILMLASEISSGFSIDYSKYKDPLKLPGGSQVSISAVVSSDNSQYIDISLLPTTNRITDDQRQFFSPKELRMSDFKIRLGGTTGVKIREYTLYSVKTFPKWSPLTPDVSGQWKTGFETQYDNKLTQRLVYNLSAGLGYTFALSSDISITGLYNIGIGSTTDNAYIYHYPEVIVQVDEIFDMKTTLIAKKLYHEFGQKGSINSLSLYQDYFFRQNFGVQITAKDIRSSFHRVTEFSAGITWYF